MKGIVLAGGSGTRLYPTTVGVVKQLLPIYDKPMIYYPLSVLMLAGIREILIISTTRDLGRFEEILGDGSRFGMKLCYAVQEQPRGLADAFRVGESFIGSDDVCLVLGDNLLYGDSITTLLRESVTKVQKRKNAVVFGYHVTDPTNYGVVEFDTKGRVLSLEEKPRQPKSNYAIIGLYFYPNRVVAHANKIKPSPRGELEITDINQRFLDEGSLEVTTLGRGYAWLDTGSSDTLLEAGQFVQTIELRQGQKIACLEEIALNNKWISPEILEEKMSRWSTSRYGKYVLEICRTGQQMTETLCTAST